ncbi:methyl-CpG-binding domain-containing protein 11-like [Vitis riparia]|uniref:methyl-CpG-binding domain-containing protein 11-like n=1 Tax=Vitis riparia TaxID=96939 RepID=UPI00155A44D0|nr:methyl-CpG-binding domain-containing protein 11-like [Vitis riparia]
MATSQADKDFMKEQHSPDDVVSIDLPAPQGWTKKFTPKKGGTPRRNEIIFVSPTGEEIKNRSQLDRFLKSHPGGPSCSEFDWGTGDSPRRSARISGKSKATETPRTKPPRKKQAKSNSKEGVKGKNDDTNGEGEVTEKQAAAAADGTEASEEVEMKDVKDVGKKSKVEVAAAEDTENDSQLKSDEKFDEMDIGQLQNQEVDNKTDSDPKEETDEKLEGEPDISPKLESKEAVDKTEGKEAGNKSLPEPGQDEKKEEEEKQPADLEAPASLTEKEGDVLKDAVAEVDAKLEEKCEAKVGQEEKEASTEKRGEWGRS